MASRRCFWALLLSFLVLGCASEKKAPQIELSAAQDSLKVTEPAAAAPVMVAPPTPKGVLEVVSGRVQVKIAKTGEIAPVLPNEEILPQDTIMTGPGGRAKLVMSDKNEITISPSSQVEIARYEAGEDGQRHVLLKLITGKIRAKVNQKYDSKDSQFMIITRAAVSGVRGTDFAVDFDDEKNRAQVVTFSGDVEYGLPGPENTIANAVNVPAGKTSVATAGKLPTKPVPMSSKELEKWDKETTLTSSVAPAAQEESHALAAKDEPSSQSHAASEMGVTGDVSLGWLRNGNTRFVKNYLRNDGQNHDDVMRLSKGQHPHAIVLSCSDSRVPPELVFDQKLGEIFVVRTAGESLDDNVIASIEYAVVHLGARLLLVMGHTSCGAVKAAVNAKPGQSSGSPALDHLVLDIQSRIYEAPVVVSSAATSHAPSSPDLAQESWKNARGIVHDLKTRSTILRDAIEKGGLVIQSALYNLNSGVVQFD